MGEKPEEKKSTRPTHSPGPARRRWWPRWSRRTWIQITVSALGTVVLGVPVAFVAWFMFVWEGPGKPQPIDCAQAMDWAGATLPKTSRDARCTEAVWMDVYDHVEFRMPANEAAGWVAGTWPAGEVETRFCDPGVDFCVRLESDEGQIAAYDGTGAPAGVDVSVRYEGGDTALVTVAPFTT
ncbi:hypothetical protein [Streptomyces laurentii]|uniref:hypothetical protein n=1 Tax=Streptomyces laurentii TaxID=39478 RepID=UPI003694DF0D